MASTFKAAIYLIITQAVITNVSFFISVGVRGKLNSLTPTEAGTTLRSIVAGFLACHKIMIIVISE